MTTQFILICLLGASIGIDIVYGCKCTPQLPDIQFCNSDWVAHVKILSKENTTQKAPSDPTISIPMLRYNINLIHMFKTHNMTNVPPPTQIFTADSAASCGIDGLEMNTEYLLSGKMSSTMTYEISSCGQMAPEGAATFGEIPQKWASVPEIQKKMIHSDAYIRKCGV
uniref:NTR domain-containing protein n=1 Tax=Rhabditophanes sp. KR3021 TaxID=114890 RepID=A0AC35TGG6_9BILA